MKARLIDLYLLCFFLVSSKIIIWGYFKIGSISLFGGGNDSDLYHRVAIYELDVFTSSWPYFLRFLYDYGLYKREVVSLILLLLSIFVIPYLFSLIVCLERWRRKLMALAILVILYYPTIFFYTFDLYRDIVIYTFCLFSFYFSKKFFEVGSKFKLFWLVLFFCSSSIAFSLREYIGFSFVLAFFLYYLFSSILVYQKTMLFFYLLGLLIFNQIGFLDPILLYRGVDGFSEGGATLGIGLYGLDPFSFLYKYIFSFIFQMFGLYLVGFPALLAFFLESVPFIFCFVYVVVNVSYHTKFSKYLLCFFVVYSTVWVLGNDNLGTAVRLRVPSYFAIMACAFIIFQVKQRYSLTKLNLGS